MRGIHRQLSTVEDVGQPAVFVDVHFVHRPGAWVGGIVLDAFGVVGKMLIQGPAKVDAQHLHPVADGEDGEIALERFVQKRPFELVPPMTDPGRPGVLGTAIPGRIYIAAAWQEQADRAFNRRPVVGVEPEHDVEMLGLVLVRQQAEGREDLGVAPRVRDGFGVCDGQASMALTPLTHNHYVRPIGLSLVTIAFRDIQSFSRPLKWSCYV
jgi:hypothetical protein